MIRAEWRIIRTDTTGNALPPMDYTDREQALGHLGRARALGIIATLQQWNQFTNEWTDTGQ